MSNVLWPRAASKSGVYYSISVLLSAQGGLAWWTQKVSATTLGRNHNTIGKTHQLDRGAERRMDFDPRAGRSGRTIYVRFEKLSFIQADTLKNETDHAILSTTTGHRSQRQTNPTLLSRQSRIHKIQKNSANPPTQPLSSK